MLDTRLSPEGLAGIFQIMDGVRRSSVGLVCGYDFVPPLVTGPRCFVLTELHDAFHVSE